MYNYLKKNLNEIIERTSISIYWIYFWGLLTLILAQLTEQTQNNWAFVATMVSVTILVAGTLFKIIKIAHRKMILRNPYYIVYTSTTQISKDQQYILFSITARTNISLNFMCLSFEGQEDKPQILNLYHCVSGRILTDDYIPRSSFVKGGWVWQYQPPLHQPGISLALAFKTTKSFDGVLRIDLDNTPASRTIYDLPLKITETQASYNGKGKKYNLW